MECPICGEFEGERKQVRAHIQGMSDDRHRGVGFQKADELLDVHHREEGTDERESPDASGSAGGELHVPSDSDSDSDSDDDEDEDDDVCLECGGDLWDLREHDSRADYACVDCGTLFEDE